jgi:hypothetical protein
MHKRIKRKYYTALGTSATCRTYAQALDAYYNSRAKDTKQAMLAPRDFIRLVIASTHTSQKYIMTYIGRSGYVFFTRKEQEYSNIYSLSYANALLSYSRQPWPKIQCFTYTPTCNE